MSSACPSNEARPARYLSPARIPADEQFEAATCSPLASTRATLASEAATRRPAAVTT